MTIRRAKPIGRGTPPKRGRLRQGKGAKAERETPALDAFRFAVFERARGYCEVRVICDEQKPFPFYEIITRDDREMVCGKDEAHRGDNAHHVWPEDRDAGIHVPERGLYLCWRSHRWVHDHPAQAKRLGLLRPDLPEERTQLMDGVYVQRTVQTDEALYVQFGPDESEDDDADG